MKTLILSSSVHQKKKIIKNSEYNYQTFLAKDLKEKDLDKFKIESKKRTILYSVKQGDNLYKISDIFDVSVESIKQINDFESSDLMPGQIIKIAIRAF